MFVVVIVVFHFIVGCFVVGCLLGTLFFPSAAPWFCSSCSRLSRVAFSWFFSVALQAYRLIQVDENIFKGPYLNSGNNCFRIHTILYKLRNLLSLALECFSFWAFCGKILHKITSIRGVQGLFFEPLTRVPSRPYIYVLEKSGCFCRRECKHVEH